MTRILRLMPLLRSVNSVNQAAYMRTIIYILKQSGVRMDGDPLWIAPSAKLDLSGVGTIALSRGCVISENVALLTHDFSLDRVAHLYEDIEQTAELYRSDPITVGENAFLGMNVVVLPGVDIGRNSIIGAGSVVTKNVQSDTVVAGNPARAIGSVDEYWQSSRHKFSIKNRRR